MSYTINEFHTYVVEENVEAIKFLMAEGLIELKDGKLFATSASKAQIKVSAGFWDQRQQARKILLNSLYGALLNEGCRFFDKRIGQSVTLSGRSIAKHMNSKVNECITGNYQYDGTGIVYADTDSSYFSAYNSLKADPEMADLADDRDAILDLYKGIGDTVNESFPIFMNEYFNTGIENGEIIAAGLELIANSGIFIKKKKYAVLKFWDETNGRLDEGNGQGKLKTIGLDIKRSDTPKVMQDFLETTLWKILLGDDDKTILAAIKDFRVEFRKLEAWKKGSPKKVNKLTFHQNRILDEDDHANIFTRKVGKKVNNHTPGHVTASVNWNKLRKMNGDKYSAEIQDGDKVIVCKLKNNPLKMNSVSYPYDQHILPKWFKNLPFDDELMEEIIIDKKVKNLIGVLNWDLTETRDDTTFNDLFTF